MSAKLLCHNAPRLRGLLTGGLPAGEQAELEQHLESCQACQSTLQELSDGGEKWAELAGDLVGEETRCPDDSGERRLLERLGASPQGETTAGPTPPEGTGTPFLDPPTAPGQLGRMGPYDVRKLLGRGGMGVVFEAYDPKLRRAVALKVLAPHLADTPGARERFLREARAAAGISHDHVVAVHGVEEAGPAPYLVMQLVRGGSLEDRLRQGGPLLPAEAARLASQVARGLAAAHARGLTHRDVKPANVLIEEGTGCARLTDFGLARAADDVSLTQSGAVAGTPSYMAPEQAAGKGQASARPWTSTAWARPCTPC